MKRLALAALLTALAIVPAAAQTKVTWMHIASIPEELAIMEAAVAEYEAANPGIDIELQFLENEAFKAKLTTLLQSDEAPDFFHSWGGGVLNEQAAAGVLRPIEDVVSQATPTPSAPPVKPPSPATAISTASPATSPKSSCGTTRTCSIRPASIRRASPPGTAFLAAVQKFKDAGITPLAMGGKDKWPAHFWWSKLVVRLAGQEAFDAASRGEGEGFAGAPFVKAGEMFLQLAALEPFQEGFLAATYGDASGYFGDGKAAMHLMGDWDYGAMKDNSASKAGIPDESSASCRSRPSRVARAIRPTRSAACLGGCSRKNASDEAVKFVEWYNSAEVQARFAEKSFYIPIAKGAADDMTNPFKVQSRAEHQWRALARAVLRSGAWARSRRCSQRHLGRTCRWRSGCR